MAHRDAAELPVAVVAADEDDAALFLEQIGEQTGVGRAVFKQRRGPLRRQIDGTQEIDDVVRVSQKRLQGAVFERTV